MPIPAQTARHASSPSPCLEAIVDAPVECPVAAQGVPACQLPRQRPWVPEP